MNYNDLYDDRPDILQLLTDINPNIGDIELNDDSYEIDVNLIAGKLGLTIKPTLIDSYDPIAKTICIDTSKPEPEQRMYIARCIGLFVLES